MGSIRIILDSNKNAFGTRKIGIPNRPVGYDLHRYGVDVRWAYTRGEQCYSKMLLKRSPTGRPTLLLGSENYSRRNLNDSNLETDVLTISDSSQPALNRAYRLWNNEEIELTASNTLPTMISDDYAICSTGLWKQPRYQNYDLVHCVAIQ